MTDKPTADAQLALSNAVEVLQALPKDSLRPADAELFRVYVSQCLKAISEASVA